MHNPRTHVQDRGTGTVWQLGSLRSEVWRSRGLRHSGTCPRHVLGPDGLGYREEAAVVRSPCLTHTIVIPHGGYALIYHPIVAQPGPDSGLRRSAVFDGCHDPATDLLGLWPGQGRVNPQ